MVVCKIIGLPMYAGFLKSVSSMKGSKESKVIPQKQLNQVPSSTDMHNIDLLSLAHMTLQFKESLKKFNFLCLQISDCDKCVSALRDLHETLGEVLTILKKIVNKYPGIACPEVFTTVNALVKYIQSCQKSGFNADETNRLINRLALFLSKSITQYILHNRQSSTINSTLLKKLERKSGEETAIFGVELEKYLSRSKSIIPFVVLKCIKEIDDRGTCTKGIYRVSAVKSKVNQLCTQFEKLGNDIELGEVSPNIIANVLKLYLRQLPQPLFTYDLYPEFIRVAKLYAGDLDSEGSKRCCEELRRIINKLPRFYFATASAVMQHLQRVSKEADTNNMSAYNLAVIFGPTLLHCITDNSDAGPENALIDNTYQIRTIELMITWADILF